MGFLSKVWKGVKKTVKKVARSIKKVAKKVAHAIPGGKKLWEFGTKVGKGVMKGIGKITSALGPIGTMALSFVLAPVMGPMISSLWSGFGAGAAAMAGSANLLVKGLGVAGQAIFNGANFVSGTLGAMGDAITKGIGQVAKGNFGAAGTEFMGNMTSAFSGEAGSAAVQAGTKSALGAMDIGNQGLNAGDLAKSTPDQMTMDMGLTDAKGNLIDFKTSDLTPGIDSSGFSIKQGASDALSSVDFSAPSTFGTPAGQINQSAFDAAVNAPGATLDSAGNLLQNGQAAGSSFQGFNTALDPNNPASVEAMRAATFDAPPSFGSKAKEAVKRASSAFSGGGGGTSGSAETSGFAVGRQFTEISQAGQTEAIRGAGGDSSLFQQLIAQASQQNRGGFA